MPRASGAPLMPGGMLKPAGRTFYSAVDFGKAYLIAEVIIGKEVSVQ